MAPFLLLYIFFFQYDSQPFFVKHFKIFYREDKSEVIRTFTLFG